MRLYVITDSAGKEVAGRRHDGAGSVISLTESQAKHELLIGSIKLHVPSAATPKAKGRG